MNSSSWRERMHSDLVVPVCHHPLPVRADTTSARQKHQIGRPQAPEFGLRTSSRRFRHEVALDAETLAGASYGFAIKLFQSGNADHQPVVAVDDPCDYGPPTTRLHGVVTQIARQ